VIRPCTIRTQLFDQEGGEIITGKMQPAVIVSQPYVVANGGSISTVGVKATRSLGITQIVVGSLTFFFGILNTALVNFWEGYIGFALWGGIWIVIGGILGVASAGNTSSKCLNGTNMAFAIVSTLLMVIDLAFYAIAVGEMRNYDCGPNYYYPNCNYTTNSTGVAIYSCLLALSVAEFGISVAVTIFCCKYGCSGCYDGETRGMVAQQPYMAPSSALLQPGSQISSYQTYDDQPTSYATASYPHGYQPTSYPATSYPHGFGSLAPPPYTPYQQDTYTTTESAAATQPTTVTSDASNPQEKQSTPP